MAESSIIIGLMSGTSTDGIDAAAVRVWEQDGCPGIELLGFVTRPYSDATRRALLDCASDRCGVAALARLNFHLGELLADAAAEVMAQTGLTSRDVEAIGSHGHTVAHLPQPAGPDEPAATMQIGEAAVIAERLGIKVVCDFRVRDVAAGGQGAPLVPWFDYTFLTSPHVNRIALNIGGIANVTVLRSGRGPDDLVAFDVGPGNMPLDAAVAMLGLPGCEYDDGGKLAASGSVDNGLLAWMLDHEFLRRSAPKSCGREEFGEQFVRAAVDRAGDLSPGDLLATLTEGCGRAAGEAIVALRGGDGGEWEIIASGGGIHNPVLLGSIGRHARMPVRTSEELGIPSDAKEAMAFAFLAWETLRGRAANVLGATGATGRRVLGKIVLR